ncbi:MAG: dephospho-CoA kinase [Candidatus Peregrinibacteria bacterium]|nr:dephospho-CoA kinase [Candidatus Peregrinibacteria bacterium]
MVIGITGKIASGKSRLMKEYEERGFYCIYADKIVHDLYVSGGVGAKVLAAVFGKKFLNEDGSVDRMKLRDVVFTDEAKLKLLNDVIHPLVYEEISILMKKKKSENIAIEATYFDPNFLEDFVDEVVLVERPKEEIIECLVKERGFTVEMAENAWSLVF